MQLLVLFACFILTDASMELCEEAAAKFIGMDDVVRVESSGSGLRVIHLGETVRVLPFSCTELLSTAAPASSSTALDSTHQPTSTSSSSESSALSPQSSTPVHATDYADIIDKIVISVGICLTFLKVFFS